MKSTKSQFEDFMLSYIWQDMKTEMLLELSAVRDELEDPNNARERDMYLKGKADLLRYASDLPQFIVDKWEELTKDEGEVPDAVDKKPNEE